MKISRQLQQPQFAESQIVVGESDLEEGLDIGRDAPLVLDQR